MRKLRVNDLDDPALFVSFDALGFACTLGDFVQLATMCLVGRKVGAQEVAFLTGELCLIRLSSSHREKGARNIGFRGVIAREGTHQRGR